MKLELKKNYSGFQVEKITPLEDIDGIGYELKHLISGARLLYIATEDDNKVFTIGFPTPSTDDTGVAHITEHSVLCGSRKYPLREPFVELVKGSLNTFLNAMTYSDKTLYPVASRNPKDFRNLMDVYLDAVFYPNIYANSFTLAQEGWHYELSDPEGELTYNGVVYNEMKGVYSAADAVEENEINKALFPQTSYRFESGGYPDAIPTLTQEAFTNFHRTHYCGENAYIYLYGNIDILDTLAYLDGEYLGKMPALGKEPFKVELQQAFLKTKEVVATYSLPNDEDPQHKTFLSLNIVTGNALAQKRELALKLLNSVLLDGNDAPLRLALVEAGIGADISGGFATSMLQPIFSIRASGSDAEKLDDFVRVIYSTLQKLTKEGINKELLTAAINALEFKLREADFGLYPKGLLYGLNCYDYWLYGGDPFLGLQFTKLLTTLRKQAEGDYFEKLIETYLLDNSHKVLLVLKPELGKEEAKAFQDKHELLKIKNSFTSEEKKKYINLARELHKRQEQEDSPEALATIPVLQRHDIRRAVESETYQLVEEDGSKILYLPQHTNKIAYLRWNYDLTGIEPELLPYVYFYTDVLGKVNTRDFTYPELSTFTNTYTGGISFRVKVQQPDPSSSDYSIVFHVRAKALEEQVDKVYTLLHNLALTSDFSNKQRIKEILAEVKTDWDNNFFARGQTVAISRLLSYFSPAARVAEQDQLSYYDFIKKLWDNFEEEYPRLLANLELISKNIFHRQDSLFAYSCSENMRNDILKKEAALKNALSVGLWAGKKAHIISAPGANEGITTSGKVQYVIAGGNYRSHGYSFTGAMKVLESILRYGYLWTKIRVQGGAYGANASFDYTGQAYFSSYRDPNLAESLEAYQQLPAYLATFSATEREMTKYVIGTMSSLDVPLTASMHLDKAMAQESMGLSLEERQLHRDEVIDASAKDIRALAPLVEAVLKDQYLCVVGNETKILANQELFKSIKKV